MDDPEHPGDQDAPSKRSSLIADYSFKTSRLDEFEDVLTKLLTRHILTPTEREARLHGGFGFSGWSDLSHVNMHFGCNLSADLASEASDDRIGFTIATRGSSELVLRGKKFPVAGSNGVTFTSGPARTLVFGDGYEGEGIMMNRYRIADYCAKLLGRDIEGHVDFDTQFNLDSVSGQSWLRLYHYASAELTDPMSLARRLPAARQQLEQMVITGFLLSHRSNYSDALLRPQSSAAPHYVKRAETYIEARFNEPLSLADIAAQSGVSARSLQNGFQNFRHMTPMAFLRKVRLQHVHQALLKADPALATVTDLAIGCGFGHMGEFAALYKRTYGVSPRETLQKKLKA
ncbi:helix-turn-helix domain-containing protein [Microvirga subterranea]|uniref:AraC family transcriptional regulator n=1 Tax=Microvirga subterranea TaxID=186651 RepID=A0A370HGQ8_9HYPH|nr:helix-turn-helix domain-containing protein [Microvirga subterranea]RDI57095.1 AraC family transcriptional regulator [Microvirga subterranea]